MPKITSVEPQKKTLRLRSGQGPHRFNIFLDGVFAFGADEDLVVENRLVEGKLLDTSDVEQLLFEAEVGKLMEKMYGLFNIRQRSEREVRNYFRVKNLESRIKGKEEISDLAIELVIKKLKQKNLINDEEFAKAWVESRSRKYGINRIKQELFQKGINREIIEEVTRVESLESSEEVAQQLLEKKMRVWKDLPILEFKKKAYEFLMRRGFEFEVVKAVVEKYLKKE
ncbi:RecX family transcriptional regulator [Candidatus Daviesbacteria bacterium]|nr:RecX family transcriptional regulator [Candidatus Daviesbacteria bacterium]